MLSGRTNDPFHEGHVTAIRYAAKYFSRVIIAPTTQNPWKESEATDIHLRIEMINLVLAAEKIALVDSPNTSGICILNYNYCYSEELVSYLRKTLPGTLYWLVGADSKESVAKWRNWSQLGVTTVVAPVIIDQHSLEIRNGCISLHPALIDFASQHGLYKPNIIHF